MIEFRICPDCGGYKIVPILENTDFHGTTNDSQHPCTCKLKDEEKEEWVQSELWNQSKLDQP